MEILNTFLRQSDGASDNPGGTEGHVLLDKENAILIFMNHTHYRNKIYYWASVWSFHNT